MIPSSQNSLHPILVFMASSSHLFFFFFFFICTTAAYNHHVDGVQSAIQKACKATRWPESCQVSLTKSGLIVAPDPNPFQILVSALTLSSKNVGTAKVMIRAILHYTTGDRNLTTTAKLCLQTLGHSAYRLRSAAEVLLLPRSRIKDARAWTSAALSYQFDCLSGFKKVNDTQMVAKTMSFMNNTLLTSTSNALSMMMSYQEFGNRTDMWRVPMTEREGVWESSVSGSGREPGVPPGLKANVTVCKKGGACIYETVQRAVNAAPENLGGGRRFVILIKKGVYEETVRIPLAKRNVVFIGEGMGKTVITGALNVGQLGMTTYDTATVGVVGDGFIARDLTIQNTAGPDAHQAVAFRSDSDLSVIENCEFIGNQDTLYAHSLRQLYKSCIIQGNVDFIFGNSAAVFHKCAILVRPRQLHPEMGGNSVIAAHGRTDPAQTTGFVFRECVVNGSEDYMKLYRKKASLHQTYLGRPWKEFSRCVFVRCKLTEIVSPRGWMAWDGEFALKTLYFGESGNSGLGANLTGRVTWSSRTPVDRVDSYSLHNFIQADEWPLT